MHYEITTPLVIIMTVLSWCWLDAPPQSAQVPHQPRKLADLAAIFSRDTFYPIRTVSFVKWSLLSLATQKDNVSGTSSLWLLFSPGVIVKLWVSWPWPKLSPASSIKANVRGLISWAAPTPDPELEAEPGVGTMVSDHLISQRGPVTSAEAGIRDDQWSVRWSRIKCANNTPSTKLLKSTWYIPQRTWSQLKMIAEKYTEKYEVLSKVEKVLKLFVQLTL